MNILILTTLYQEPDDAKNAATTPVVHNFAREWVKMGHRVVVIHNFNVFLKPLYYVPKALQDIISNKLGFRVSLNVEQRRELNYIKDGVTVYKIPILKIIPMGSYSTHQLNRQWNRILKALSTIGFVPDIVVGHAENPQIWQLYMAKKEFVNTRTGIVFHGIEYLQRKNFEKWKDVYLESIDSYGFRSLNILKKAEEVIGFSNDYFLCPSGIADEYVGKFPQKSRVIRKLLFVGQLIERKHPETILDALSEMKDKDYELTIVGIGSQKEMLEKKASTCGLNVSFTGQLPHKEVLELMRENDCFIMISEAEVFGLVYLEALSQGCITIAAKDEGMDGIIRNGYNGFLCQAGNKHELGMILNYISNMKDCEIETMRRNGFDTAKQYSESEVARQYLLKLEGGVILIQYCLHLTRHWQREVAS